MHIPTGGKKGGIDLWTPADVTKLRCGELGEVSTVVIAPGDGWNIAAC